MRPIKYSVYKGMSGKYGAVQFSLSPPIYQCDFCKVKNYNDSSHPVTGCGPGNMVARDGAVFIDVANSTGPNVYDWEHKTIFALSVTDMGKVLSGLRSGTGCKLLHDPGAQTATAGQVVKTVQFGEVTEKGCLFNVMEKNKSGEEKKFMVPLSADEVTIIGTLIARAIPVCLAW